MNVSLTPELEKLVSRRVKSGRYQTASEVIREALRLLEERDQMTSRRLAELRTAIQEGLESGEAAPLRIAELKREVRRRIGRAPRTRA
jgi:antitoxin ParD1/3/4